MLDRALAALTLEDPSVQVTIDRATGQQYHHDLSLAI